MGLTCPPSTSTPGTRQSRSQTASPFFLACAGPALAFLPPLVGSVPGQPGWHTAARAVAAAARVPHRQASKRPSTHPPAAPVRRPAGGRHRARFAPPLGHSAQLPSDDPITPMGTETGSRIRPRQEAPQTISQDRGGSYQATTSSGHRSCPTHPPRISSRKVPVTTRSWRALWLANPPIWSPATLISSS